MRIKHLIAGVATAGLLGITPIALSAPAQATATLTTATTLTTTTPAVGYGAVIDLVGAVNSSDGGTAVYGLATLQVATTSNPTWTSIATDESPGFLYFPGITGQENAQYKVVYSGYTAQSEYQDTYIASESAPLGVSVARKITYPKKGFVLKGKVTPSYAKKKVVIKVSKKSNKKFKKFKTVKTNKRGKYKVKLPKRRGVWYWQVSTKADSSFAATGYTWRTSVY